MALATPFEHEGLLRALPGGGYVVSEFTRADIVDAAELRAVLEGTAARFAAEHGAPTPRASSRAFARFVRRPPARCASRLRNPSVKHGPQQPLPRHARRDGARVHSWCARSRLVMLSIPPRVGQRVRAYRGRAAPSRAHPRRRPHPAPRDCRGDRGTARAAPRRSPASTPAWPRRTSRRLQHRGGAGLERCPHPDRAERRRGGRARDADAPAQAMRRGARPGCLRRRVDLVRARQVGVLERRAERDRGERRADAPDRRVEEVEGRRLACAAISAPKPPCSTASCATTSRPVRLTDSTIVSRSSGTSVRGSITSASMPSSAARRSAAASASWTRRERATIVTSSPCAADPRAADRVPARDRRAPPRA